MRSPVAAAARSPAIRRQGSRWPGSSPRRPWPCVGTSRRPDETAREFADRASNRLPTQSSELHALAASADAAVFGVDLVDDDAARRAEESTGSVRTLVAQQRPRWRRVLTYLDVRDVRVDQPPLSDAD